MPHAFDPDEKRKLDGPGRRAEMPPEETLHAAGIRPMDTFLDIGCGTGYFTLTAARLVGTKGRVYALDVSSVMLADLRTRIAESGIFNIEDFETAPCDFKLPDAAGTMAFLSDVLHEVQDKFEFMMEVNRVLKTGGRLAIIEWQKKDAREGPPLKDRLEEDEILNLLDRSGFTRPAVAGLSRTHALYTCVKK